MASSTAPSNSGTSATASPAAPKQPHPCNRQQVVSPPLVVEVPVGTGGAAAPPTPTAPVGSTGIYLDVHAPGSRTAQRAQHRQRMPSTAGTVSPANLPLSPRAVGHHHAAAAHSGVLGCSVPAGAAPSQHFTPRAQQHQPM